MACINDHWQSQVRQVAQGIRRRVMEHTVRNHGGYLSQACSAAEILATLYLRIMHLGKTEKALVPAPFAGVPGPDNSAAFTGALFNGPRGPEYDRFILSPSQYALVLYALLIETGRMDPAGLEQFNVDGFTVEMIGAEHSPGMEVMTGSLGQGLSQAAGIAMARRLKGESGKVWVFMSDGEWQSGQNWEALQAITHHKLDNIGIYVDVNGQQCDGAMCDVMAIEPFADRLTAFGARVYQVDGHNLDALVRPVLEPGCAGKPVIVLADTKPWQGIDILKKRYPKLHYVRFASGDEQAEYAGILQTML
ncbi:transketolase [Sporomusa termitida]|uniref:Transketolase n=1 Tax=Sporomusa termitida TaxID=2377 RepID=A0A517DPE2_9FIRM|nr:1-deoxy-D-xylulose-5-phosphate synthase N-terminal domain-containing protein [Sporomusa termitida]QDR79235.1 transketolase [Sporomusa termitida]